MAGSASPRIQGEGGASGPGLGVAAFIWTRCGVLAAFDMKVGGGGTSLVADVGRFRDEHRVGNVSAAGAPLLDSANPGSLPVGLVVGTPGGFELLRQGFELILGLFDHLFDLVGPCLRVV